MLILGTQGEGGSIYRQGIHNCFLICFQNPSALSLIATAGSGVGTGGRKTGEPGAPLVTRALCEISCSRNGGGLPSQERSWVGLCEVSLHREMY